MPGETVRVVAHILARPETTDEVKALLVGLIAPTREEDGCIRYELQQNNAEQTDFVFNEEWQSDAALDTHLASAHVQAALPQLGGLLASPVDIRRYRLVA